MYDDIWSYMIIDDPIWSYMIIYHYVLPYMIIYYHIWSYMIIYSHMWSCMLIYNLIWAYMIIYDRIWSCVPANLLVPPPSLSPQVTMFTSANKETLSWLSTEAISKRKSIILQSRESIVCWLTKCLLNWFVIHWLIKWRIKQLNDWMIDFCWFL